ncbi:ComEC/Rec2 family competence protein [Jannaschia seohaensis]|uniref:Competence protein ComEC n=1 Tax=Jannaschia seohaensis TaxID=475081 RepID=A0A2Y9C760_9RHOB|nr:ComEC/Rec2 family competence protein [Jannaschia seohaensis]PWJ20395.1 competence protein ComEC [Jannaschia seohaensis]SSA44463.1 competence protein ComEC [Jannaschia seohaensis]
MEDRAAVPGSRAAPLDRLAVAVQALRGRRLPWVAVAWGTGVGLYFALPVEPTGSQVAGASVAALALLTLAWLGRFGAGFLAGLLAVALLGGLAATARTAMVAGPVLDFRYYGAVEGRIVQVDRSSSGATRITLDRVRLDRVAPEDIPRRVRVSLHGGGIAPEPGLRVMTTAHLSAPNGPVEPGGFDFQRHAWFLQLGAIGYGRIPLLEAAPAETGPAILLQQARREIAAGLRERMPGVRGDVAAALTTGDRSGLPEDAVEDLRRANLAHLLAISGLHVGLVVGFVFWAVRGGLALWPRVALRYPIRAWAAAVAIPVAAAYLLLSGATVATQRAFVMALVMLIAILAGRRAVSLRSVAIAALIVLAWRPESLTGPGFQMSFAATAALVLAFRALADRRDAMGGWLRGWRGAILSLFVSSLVAGLATAPIAAIHFNRVAQFGLLANLLAVPLMGTLVMPLLFVGLLLWPLGLEAGPLWLAGQGIAYILRVAEWVGDLPGSVSHVAAPDPWVLPVLGLGMSLFACAQRWGRAVAILPIVGACVGWSLSTRPDLLISGDGRLVGMMTETGRRLSRETGAAFVAEAWLENDGDGAQQAVAAARETPLAGLPTIAALRGKTGLDDALVRCAAGGIWVVTPVRVASEATGCEIFDEARLRETGSIAFSVATGRIETSAERQGLRPWTGAWRRILAQ